MNFSYGIIAIVGVLVAISIGFIAISPDDVPEPRIVEKIEKPTVCTMQWEPMCGADGKTYGNSCMLNAADIKLDYEGECIVVQPTVEPTPEPPVEPVMEVPVPDVIDVEEMIVEPTPEPTSDVTIVSIPPGVAVPGCDDDDSCYSPYKVSIATGATVIWSNDDSAAHTVTSGNIEAGLTGVFDSGLFMAGSTYEFTFEDAGTFDYFCMVHPWMTGFIDVS